MTPKKAPSRKPPPRSKAAKKKPARAAKPGGRARKAAPAPRKAPPTKLAAFTDQILKEEDEPVAVQSFIEARAGAAPRKELVPATGQVRSAATADEEGEDESDEEEEESSGSTDAAGEPRLDPLTGPMAVPKDRAESFEFKQPSRPKPGRGRKAEKPEEFGPVELRQATATGGRHLTTALPENLQRGASRIKALASADEAAPAKRSKDRLEIPKQADAGPAVDPKELTDFGDVVIAQQTRSGARDVGKLDGKKKKGESDE